MRTFVRILVLAFIISVISCASHSKKSSSALFDNQWELQYITGPRIAFGGLYPNKKPKISFDRATKIVQGNNSCNGYRADYSLDAYKISFGEPGPTTMMYCGEGEKVFLNTMKKVNAYGFDSSGNLELKMDEVVLMRFSKSPK
ncbi:META domain-containing protein [Cytophaga sp. FL35]|uniref:META domain-containing protein n=1 Tax=Cytophaga sp. FL35 TaxID=1904456 RepID=UPI00165358CA|nr:META domain-containing protein [Cytophaga sp. FL35]MBC6999465.1 META domain-containing protein [Cytophaga sp. FL35]